MLARAFCAAVNIASVSQIHSGIAAKACIARFTAFIIKSLNDLDAGDFVKF